MFETERLILREFSFDDAENLYMLNLDPDVIRYTGDPPFESKETARLFIYNYKDYKINGYGRWSIDLKSDGSFIGWAGLKLNKHNDVDLGYRLLKSAWGNGYATEAAQGCIKYGFEQLGQNEIIARVIPENVASVKVIEKLGMDFYKKGTCNSLDNASYYKLSREEYLSKL